MFQNAKACPPRRPCFRRGVGRSARATVTRKLRQTGTDEIENIASTSIENRDALWICTESGVTRAAIDRIRGNQHPGSDDLLLEGLLLSSSNMGQNDKPASRHHGHAQQDSTSVFHFIPPRFVISVTTRHDRANRRRVTTAWPMFTEMGPGKSE